MFTIQQFQRILADTMFAGNMDIAGMVIFSVVLVIIFVICRDNILVGILISIPATLVFSTLEVLNSELTMLLIVIEVLILAMSAKRTFGD